MATLDELLAQSEPNGLGQIVPPGQPPMGMSLDDLLRQSDPELQGGQSTIQSETLTPEEESQQRLFELIGRTPVESKRSLIPQGVGGATGSAVVERYANQLTQRLPPRLKFLGVPLRILGAVAGAFGGGASGRGYQQLAAWGDIDENVFREQLESGAQEAISELGGQFAGGLIGRVLSGGFPGVAKRQFPRAQELSDKLTEGGKRVTREGVGENLSEHTVKSLQAGEAGLTEGERGRSLLTNVEKFVRSTIGGGKLNDRLKELNPAALKQLQRELVDQYWKEAGVAGRASPDEIADEISKVINRQMDEFHQRFSTKILNGKKPLDPQVIGNVVEASREAVVTHNKGEVSNAYKAVEDLTLQSGIASQEVGNIVPLNKTLEIAKAGFERWSKKPRNTAMKKEMLELYTSVLEGPAKTTIEDADKGLRSDLLAKARALLTPGTRSINPTKSAAIKELADAARTDLGTSLNRFDPAINDALLKARSRAAENIRLEEHPFVKKIHTLLDDSRPEDLIKHIFKDGSPSGIELAQRSLGQETVAELADTWLNKQVTESLTNKQSIGIDLKKRLNKLGRPSLDKIFGKRKTNDLYAVASTFKKEGSQFLENKVIKGALNLVESNPTLVAHRISQRNNTPLMLKWRKQLGPQRFKRVQAAWIDDAVKKGNFSTSLDNLGDKMLKATFSDPKHLQHLKDIGRMEEILGAASDGSSVLAKLIQAGAVGAFVAAPGQAIKGTAASTAVGLGVAGQLLAHKPSAKWIARGVKNPRLWDASLRKATAELARVIRVAYREKTRREGKAGVTPSVLPRGI